MNARNVADAGSREYKINNMTLVKVAAIENAKIESKMQELEHELKLYE